MDSDGLLRPTAQPGITARVGGLGGAALAARDADGVTVSAERRKVQVTETLAYALSGTAVGKSMSTRDREASGEGATVTVVLAEYATDQAQSAMYAVGTASTRARPASRRRWGRPASRRRRARARPWSASARRRRRRP
ncbi:hypothetical protein [Streptomyces sp. NPDC002328]|uniref:hypothetical protein n=1 Tax=Streptomyces sp. NPDC002328 TaxID=3364642 RepID=UPI0036A5DE5E